MRKDENYNEILEFYNSDERYSRTANMYASFVNVEDLADAIIELAYSDFTGIINIAGDKPVSYYDFNIYLAKLMGIDNHFIIPDYKQEEVFHSLNSDKRKLLFNTLIRDI